MSSIIVYSGFTDTLFLSLTHGKETWEHAQKHFWDVRAVYAHINRLATTMLSTTESLEDVLGDLSDKAGRDTKSAMYLAPERLFMQATLSGRLRRAEPTFLRLQPGEYVAPMRSKSVESDVQEGEVLGTLGTGQRVGFGASAM